MLEVKKLIDNCIWKCCDRLAYFPAEIKINMYSIQVQYNNCFRTAATASATILNLCAAAMFKSTFNIFNLVNDLKVLELKKSANLTLNQLFFNLILLEKDAF